MHTTVKLIFVLILGWSLLATAWAASFDDSVQMAHIKEVDVKNRTILLGKYRYRLALGIKVHDSADDKLPGIRNLQAGQLIKFRTHKNKKTKQMEIREIWIIYT